MENGVWRHRPRGSLDPKRSQIHTRASFGKLLSSRPHYLGRKFAFNVCAHLFASGDKVGGGDKEITRSETSGELNFRAVEFSGRNNTFQENGDWCVASQTLRPLDPKGSRNTHPCFFLKIVKLTAPLFGKEIRRMIFSVTTLNDFKWPLRQRNNNRSKTSGELNFRAAVSPGRSNTFQANGEWCVASQTPGPLDHKRSRNTHPSFGKLLSARPHYLGRRFAEQRNNNLSETSGELNFSAIAFQGRSNPFRENGEWRHKPQGLWIIRDPKIHIRASFGKLLSSRPHYLGRRFAEW
ncbi:hypothetical protein CDAR_116661 [Caerostris darwini]|uniref:Ribosomal protein L2 n=1 Tax=Caerostris darwini TaxID=1538125 RepID=A0AAV4R184_9ARAC|nr:hypothetical protein CDAR_116661 [Caerostris darwini]